ncbi:hypothetical protein SAMN02745163_02739 [Clostridium cavendishii DSM 21758]|uniref:Uncharacterized protein n=1 Tax=Clostridium cavendishii DSM 21758 TaxID=1121302 RepID=A0A1M6MRM7_9CLOT|nr:hypothetical protein [Clostridium cavendishii]SHJ86158.1 hypothetical protein SAMN02745163_02739 [Clostridium cavendishii DSM 21758]
MKYTHKDLEFEKFVHIFNTEGKRAAKQFVSSMSNINYDYFVKLLKQYKGYVYNRNFKRYELPSNAESPFIGIDDLFNKEKDDATKLVASIPEKIYYKDPADSLTIDILQDRLMELSKYIKISQSSKTIEINLGRLRESGYDVNVQN